jgi:hypothetical protein
MGDYSSLQFAEPSFWGGVARILDFSGSLSDYNRSPTAARADAVAIGSDWCAVGTDLWTAIDAADAEGELSDQLGR